MCQSNPPFWISSQIESCPPSFGGKNSLVHQHLAAEVPCWNYPGTPKLTVTTRILTFLVGESLQTGICHWNPGAPIGRSKFHMSNTMGKKQHFLTEKIPSLRCFHPRKPVASRWLPPASSGLLDVSSFLVKSCPVGLFSAVFVWKHMDVSENSGCFPPNHPFVHRVFHYFHHPFWGTIIFGNTHI